MKTSDFYIPDGDLKLPTWKGVQAIAFGSNFDLSALLKASMEPGGQQKLGDDLFSLSPLTSPETTPNPTPPSSPQAKPADAKDLPSPEVLDPCGNRKRKKKQAGHACRKKKREAAKASFLGDAPAPMKSTEKYTAAAEPVYTAAKTKQARVASTGYVGTEKGAGPAKDKAFDLKIEGAVGDRSELKFDLVPWDGATPMAIVDQDGRIIGILAGHPDDKNWDQAHRTAAKLLEETRQRCRLPKSAARHRRGSFQTLRCGFSHGGGTEQPTNFFNNQTNAKLLSQLNSQKPIRRIAGFGSSVFRSWAPKLHQHYVDHIYELQKNDPSLRRPFRNSIFTSTTYNLGPKTVCYPHCDFGNLPYGFCAVTALGSFNPTKGGHLVLWECQLAIEFPPGSTILIPSATFTHSNLAISESETRYSMTQYAAGGLFRWVDYGFKNTANYRGTLNPTELAELDKRNSNRWLEGLALLPRLPSATDET